MMRKMGSGMARLALAAAASLLVLAGCTTLSVQEQRFKFGTEHSPVSLGTIRFSEQLSYSVLTDKFKAVDEVAVDIPQEMIDSAAADIRRIYGETGGFTFIEHDTAVQEKIDKAIDSKHTKEKFTAAGNFVKSITGNKDAVKEIANEYSYGKNFLTDAHDNGLFNLVPAGFRVFDPEEDLQKSILSKTDTNAVVSYGVSYEVENKKSELGIATRLVVHTAVTMTTKQNTRTMTTFSRSDWMAYSDFMDNPDVLLGQLGDLFRDCVTYDAENMFTRFEQ